VKAEVDTYGGPNDRVWDAGRGWVTVDTVRHWTLTVEGIFVADTDIPEESVLFKLIARRINEPPVTRESVAVTLRGLMEECRNRPGWDWENDHWLKEGRRVLFEAGWPNLNGG
jgi:hypothetical protein